MLNKEKIMTRLSFKKFQQTGDSHQAELIKQAAEDPAKFSELYRQNVAKVYRYIYARVNNHAEAEDLTSQVFMAVLQRLPLFGAGGNFNAWLFTIARNKIVDNYRKDASMVPLETIQNLSSSEDDPFSQLAQKELFTQLKVALAELTLEQRELLQLRFAAQLSYAEIGLVMGKSEAAVKMSVYRLIDKLQENLEKSNE